MTDDQFKALLDLIDTRAAVMISDALGRDSLSEAVRANEAEDAARKLFVEEDQ